MFLTIVLRTDSLDFPIEVLSDYMVISKIKSERIFFRSDHYNIVYHSKSHHVTPGI